jgi:hypothetical protein
VTAEPRFAVELVAVTKRYGETLAVDPHATPGRSSFVGTAASAGLSFQACCGNTSDRCIRPITEFSRSGPRDGDQPI